MNVNSKIFILRPILTASEDVSKSWNRASSVPIHQSDPTRLQLLGVQYANHRATELVLPFPQMATGCQLYQSSISRIPATLHLTPGFRFVVLSDCYQACSKSSYISSPLPTNLSGCFCFIHFWNKLKLVTQKILRNLYRCCKAWLYISV